MISYINDKDNPVPDKKILYLYENEQLAIDNDHRIEDVLVSLKGNIKRRWFLEPFYSCLPLTIGNQYGYAVKACQDIEVYSPGNKGPVSLRLEDKKPRHDENRVQRYYTNFQNGVLTVENAFFIKTPPGINIMTIQPPNFFIPGLHCMTGVVETDNLRRGFTFNIKVTQEKTWIKIKKGDLLAAFIPIPRFFVDSFSLEPADKYFSKEIILNDQKSGEILQIQRDTRVEVGGDIGKVADMGRRYFNGVHYDDQEFDNEHQKRIKYND